MKSFYEKKILGSLLLLSIALATPGFAQTDCKVDQKDMFDHSAKMQSGPYAGTCIDTQAYRSIQRLSSKQKESFGINPNDNSLEVFANFRYKDHFYIAVIPSERIQSVVFQMVPLAKVIGISIPIYHGQLRFKLSTQGRPVHLIEQNRNSNSSKITLKEDIVFALYGVRAAGHEEVFNPIHGIQDHYAVSFTIGTLSQNTDWALEADKPVIQYALNLSNKQAFQVLSAGIDMGTNLKMNGVYNTLTNSCLNTAFSVLDSVLNYKSILFDRIEKTNQSANPVVGLLARQLIHFDGSSRMTNLDIELSQK